MQIGLSHGFIDKDLFQSSIESFYHFKSKSGPDKTNPFYQMGGIDSTL